MITKPCHWICIRHSPFPFRGTWTFFGLWCESLNVQRRHCNFFFILRRVSTDVCSFCVKCYLILELIRLFKFFQYGIAVTFWIYNKFKQMQIGRSVKERVFKNLSNAIYLRICVCFMFVITSFSDVCVGKFCLLLLAKKMDFFYETALADIFSNITVPNYFSYSQRANESKNHATVWLQSHWGVICLIMMTSSRGLSTLTPPSVSLQVMN